MSNQKIIDEFEKLVNYIQHQIDNSKDIKTNTANTFRLKQIKNALSIVKKYPKELSIDNLSEFGELPGIGKGTINRIVEILTTGHLDETATFKDFSTEKKKALLDLESVVGIGRNTALELYNMGIKSVADLKKKIETEEIKVNDKILLGIKYYGVFQGNIPRKEIDKIYILLQSVVQQVNTLLSYDDTNHYIFEICGSYRREKPYSNDIDVLISKVDTNMNSDNNGKHLELFIQKLKTKLKQNNNMPLLVDDITYKTYETKYMGFAKYKNNPIRRIDIRFVPYDAYYSALLYFTGSAELNKKMRQIAKKMGYKLSEYGLSKNDVIIPVTSEYDIFKKLKIEYLQPNLR